MAQKLDFCLVEATAHFLPGDECALKDWASHWASDVGRDRQEWRLSAGMLSIRTAALKAVGEELLFP